MTNHFTINKPFHDNTSHRAHDRDGTTTPLSHDRPVAALPEVHLQRLRGPALNAGALNAAPLNANTSTTADVAEYRTRRHAANSSAAAPAAAAQAAAASVEAPAPDTGQEYKRNVMEYKRNGRSTSAMSCRAARMSQYWWSRPRTTSTRMAAGTLPSRRQGGCRRPSARKSS